MADLVRAGSDRMARRASGRGPVREFLTFVLAGDVFGVELTRIREILSPPPITGVPRAPRYIVGVCSVRGLLVAVVDLRLRLSLEAKPRTRKARILLAQAESGEVVGLMVDEVRHVVRLSDAEMELASTALGAEVSEFVLGVGRPDDEFIVLLDLRAVVSR
jgi:purine-binding chemotaxis protein CheW